jgi:hypothetical protein
MLFIVSKMLGYKTVGMKVACKTWKMHGVNSGSSTSNNKCFNMFANVYCAAILLLV